MVTAVRQSRQPDMMIMKTVFDPDIATARVHGGGSADVRDVHFSVAPAPPPNGSTHFSPRLIAQRAHTNRKRAPTPSSLAPHSTSKTTSLVYGHSAGLGTAAYLGPTPSDGETPGYTPTRRPNELFAKLSWQI